MPRAEIPGFSGVDPACAQGAASTGLEVLVGPGLEAHAGELEPVIRAAGYPVRSGARPHADGGQLVLLGLDASPAGWQGLDSCPAGSLAVAMFLAQPRPDEVRNAFRRGAADVLLAESETPGGVVRDFLEALRSSPGPAAGQPAGERFGGLVGVSEAMTEIHSMVGLVGPADTTVLIQGESGTGKELAARAIHAASPRADAPFMAINCGAIPPDLLEAELFGHAKGAFTGAIQSRQGRFAKVGAGTLFLDEIGEMSPDLQVKLLRVIEERTYEPLGSSRSVEFSARILAATNQDLELAVQAGRFREDLYHRLNVLSLELPALRERGGDEILYLLDHFLAQLNRKHGTEVGGVTPLAGHLLATYSWPGNVRELRNLVERLVILKRAGLVEPADLPQKVRGVQASLEETGSGAERTELERDILLGQGRDMKAEVEAFENRMIMQALEATGGNRNQAAQLLGVKRTTLVEKLKKRNLG
ncbi:sigma-54 interaction domain-containing protein [Thiohalorhabdus sp. Cl-TMA]|uniref:Sigma-54 interaction domain-containing protein n=1 Tax=Thiohalorhabdus methylotrophus TaxID=3242694 RepID=A0ABV4TW03_9GAMM